MDKNRKRQRPRAGPPISAWLLLTMLFLILVLSACRGTPEPDISPLAFVSPVIMAEPQYPYFEFRLPESVVGLSGSLTVESELRTSDGIITKTYHIEAPLPAAAAIANGDIVYIARWSVADAGDEWLRATLHVVESETVEHDLYGRMYADFGKLAQSDERGFYWHRSIVPYVVRFPIIVIDTPPGDE